MAAVTTGIVFNSTDLGTVAPVKIDDIRVSPVGLAPLARERAILPGSDFVRSRAGIRTVTITFALLESNRTDRENHLSAIVGWAKTDAEYKLTLPHYTTRYLTAVCTGHPDASYRVWWENSLRLVFTCFDNPFWTSETRNTVACGTEFTVGGNAPPTMSIQNTFNAAAENVAWSDGTNTLTLASVSSSATAVTIDLNRQIVRRGTTSLMGSVTYTSKFPVPKVGTQTITGTGTVYYRERWY